LEKCGTNVNLFVYLIKVYTALFALGILVFSNRYKIVENIVKKLINRIICLIDSLKSIFLK